MLKLGLAGRRLKELEKAATAFLDEGPFSIEWEVSEDRLSYSVHMCARAVPPDHHLGPAMGEVVHNIGSALDAIAWETATAAADAGTGPPHDVRFPIVGTDTPTSRRELARALQPFRGIPAARELIELVQPREEGGCHELLLLEALWNFDKHRGIHRTVPMQIHGEGSSASVFTDMPMDQEAPLVVPAGSGANAVPYPADWDCPWPKDGSWGLAFAPPPGTTMLDRPAYAGMSVIGTLRDIHTAVRSRIVGPLGRLLDA